MIELFTLYELFGCLVNLIENLPDSILETYLEINLQLTCVSYQIEDSREKCPSKLKLNCLRTNKVFFSLLGDKQNFKFGGI